MEKGYCFGGISFSNLCQLWAQINRQMKMYENQGIKNIRFNYISLYKYDTIC